MKIITVSTHPRLLSKHYKINESYSLTAEGMTPVPIEFKEDIYVSRSTGKTIPKETKNDLDESDKNDVEKKPESSASIKLKDLKGIGSGGGIASGAMTMFRLSNMTTKADLTKLFTNNNVTPSAADTMAETVLEYSKLSYVKSVFLAIGGGAVTFAVLEVFKPEWTLKKKLLVSFIVAVILAVIYLILARLEIMT